MNNIESLYLHFPFCKHLCNYCDFFKSIPRSNEEIVDFEKKLANSFDLLTRWQTDNGYQWSELKTLFIGGGTPSLWGAQGADFLQSFFSRNNLKLDPAGEFTIEMNPGTTNRDIIEAFQRTGLNRFSVGIQSLNEHYLKVLDRIHNIDDCFKFLDLFREMKLNYSVDLMIGLPFSKGYKRDVIAELEQLLEFGPKHFSVYILTAKNNYKYILPEDDLLASEYLLVADYLKSRGYLHYEVSNFALPGFESKHNLRYWESKSVAALGPSGTGFLAEDSLRYKWHPSLEKWDLERLTLEESQIEKVYMKLRTSEGFLIDDYFDISEQKDTLGKLMEDWARRGLIQAENPKRLALTSKGFLLLDGLIDQLFSAKIV